MSRQHLTLETLAQKRHALEALPDEARLTPPQAAEALTALGRPTAVQTLNKYRCLEPDRIPYRKHGRFVSYGLGDIRRYASGEHA